MGYFIHEDQPAGLPLANVDQLNDVNITSPANKDVLSYDSTSQKWVNDSSINSALTTKVSKTKSSAGWVGSFSVTLEESHLYLFISQRYGDVVILTVFSGGTVGAKVVAGNNWSFTSANFVLTGTASSAADYAIIEVG